MYKNQSMADTYNMISLWIVIGLIISTISVATLAAVFSIVGLGALFSGAVLAVFAMAGSLEFSKFVLAAYLHQRWNNLNKVFRGYLVFAIVVLSLITSMGVFGFLSDAYQSASTSLDAENVKLQSEKNKQNSITNELARLNKSIEEIPVTRISKKMRARQEAEPLIRDLNAKFDAIEKTIAEMNLKVIEIKKKVGPLIYISRAFNADIDSVVKYLILVFVLVFDPLAICLVIATTQALESRKHKSVKFETRETMTTPAQSAATTEVAAVSAPPSAPRVETIVQTVAPVASAQPAEVKTEAAPEQPPVAEPISVETKPVIATEAVAESTPSANEDEEELIQMNYADDPTTSEDSETKEPKVV